MKMLLLNNLISKNETASPDTLSWIREHFEGITKILFITALKGQDYNNHHSSVVNLYQQIGITKIIPVHSKQDLSVDDENIGIHVSGGNTFVLLEMLYKTGLIVEIYKKVIEQDIPYLSADSGTVVASTGINTSNDKPFVHPPLLTGICLVGFLIHTDYQQVRERELIAYQQHQLQQYTSISEMPAPIIIGLAQNSALKISDQDNIQLLGQPARLFPDFGNPTTVQINCNLAKFLPLRTKKNNPYGNYQKNRLFNLNRSSRTDIKTEEFDYDSVQRLASKL